MTKHPAKLDMYLCLSSGQRTKASSASLRPHQRVSFAIWIQAIEAHSRLVSWSEEGPVSKCSGYCSRSARRCLKSRLLGEVPVNRSTSTPQHERPGEGNALCTATCLNGFSQCSVCLAGKPSTCWRIHPHVKLDELAQSLHKCFTDSSQL